MAQYLQRAGGKQRDPPSDNGVSLPTFPIDLGAIEEFLTRQEWAPGEARVPGSLTMFAELGRLKLCLHDKDQGLVGFVTAATWLGLWSATEAQLRDGTVDWRASKEQRRR